MERTVISGQQRDTAHTLRRVAPATAGAILLLAMAILYALPDHQLYSRILSDWGLQVWTFPFLDTETVMSALRCVRAGVDVFVSNPCDPLGRLFDYSPLWLIGARLPVTAAWLVPVGLTIDIGFLLSLLLLPPGRGTWETAAIVAGVFSTASVYAAERGNNDLVLFALASAAAALACRGGAARLVGYGLGFLAGLLKYYPMTLMALALRERPLRFAAVTAACVVGLAAFAGLAGSDLMRALALLPDTFSFGDVFGARVLSDGLATAGIIPDVGAALMTYGFVVVAMALGGSIGRTAWLKADLAVLTERERTFLLAGALLVLGCFLTARNIGYRAVHLLLLIPGLTALWRLSPGRAVYPVSAWIVLLLMWAQGWRHWIRLAIAGLDAKGAIGLHVFAWLAREACWWWTITFLFALSTALFLRAETGVAIAGWWKRRITGTHVAG